MRNLNVFRVFRANDFLKGKELTCIQSGPLKDYKTKDVIGTRVEAVITRDDTDYGMKDGKPRPNNQYEKLVIKVKKMDLDIPQGTIITLAGEVTGVVYGDYQEKLSITADDVKAVQPAVPKSTQNQAMPNTLQRRM